MKVLSAKNDRSAKVDQPDVDLDELPNWQIIDGKLVAKFSFANYKSATGFVMQVAMTADRLNHHPEITLTYREVTLVLCTHDAGGAITERDITLAKRCSKLVT